MYSTWWTEVLFSIQSHGQEVLQPFKVACDFYCTYTQRKYGGAMVVFDGNDKMSTKTDVEEARISGFWCQCLLYRKHVCNDEAG